jgi:hypothetical protein
MDVSGVAKNFLFVFLFTAQKTTLSTNSEKTAQVSFCGRSHKIKPNFVFCSKVNYIKNQKWTHLTPNNFSHKGFKPFQLIILLAWSISTTSIFKSSESGRTKSRNAMTRIFVIQVLTVEFIKKYPHQAPKHKIKNAQGIHTWRGLHINF